MVRFGHVKRKQIYLSRMRLLALEGGARMRLRVSVKIHKIKLLRLDLRTNETEICENRRRRIIYFLT